MPKTPFLEKKSSLKVLGAAFVAVLLFFGWISWAFFTQSFTERETVYLKSASAGLQLPRSADVKLNGMIVGEVTNIASDKSGVTLDLGIKPEMIDKIPAGVSAEIIPKTLFGQKYIALLPPEDKQPGHLMPGDTIEKAYVPVEVEKLLNDFYPLLQAVEPAELSYTLSALSTALEGRGAKLGETLLKANDYFKAIDPDISNLVNDLVLLGQTSGVYSAAMPDLTRLLKNVTVTSKTIVAERQNLVTFFDNTEALAKTADEFFDESGAELVSLNDNAEPVLNIVADYSSTFPCFTEALETITPMLDSAFRGGTLHINAELLGPLNSPTAYTATEETDVSLAAVQASTLAQPTCLDLAAINDGARPYPQSHPYVISADTGLYSLVGLDTRHNKYCDPDSPNWGSPSSVTCGDGPLPRTAALGYDTLEERDALNSVIAAWLGMDSDEVPDVASLLVSPVLRGTVVSGE